MPKNTSSIQAQLGVIKEWYIIMIYHGAQKVQNKDRSYFGLEERHPIYIVQEIS